VSVCVWDYVLSDLWCIGCVGTRAAV